METSPALVGLRLAMDPKDSCWELPLGAVEGAEIGLIGWILERPGVDAGVPRDVQYLLTRSLCVHWKISFPLEKAAGAGGDFAVTSTDNPEDATRLFESALFPWTARGQVALLSPVAEPDPPLSRQTIKAIFRESKSTFLSLRAEFGVTGMLQPAVDGDFAVISLLDNQWSQLVPSLAEECARQGVNWSIISETQFRDCSWYVDQQLHSSGVRKP